MPVDEPCTVRICSALAHLRTSLLFVAVPVPRFALAAAATRVASATLGACSPSRAAPLVRVPLPVRVCRQNAQVLKLMGTNQSTIETREDTSSAPPASAKGQPVSVAVKPEISQHFHTPLVTRKRTVSLPSHVGPRRAPRGAGSAKSRRPSRPRVGFLRALNQVLRVLFRFNKLVLDGAHGSGAPRRR